MYGAKIGGCAPLGNGSWVPIEHNVASAEAYQRAKFHLDPSNRLASARMLQTDRQRSDSIGRTVLQTVAQKSTGSGLWGSPRNQSLSC